MNRSVSRYPGSSMAKAVTLFAVRPVFFGVLATVCCFFPSGVPAQEPGPVPPAGQSRSTAIIWTELLQKTPYPHTAPLPPEVRTALDGTYAKFDPKKIPPVPCRRCPDYMPEGGIWKMNLDKGIFRIFHEVTGWRSLGSFIVDRNRVQLFNDPYCMEVNGFYRWTSADGHLILQVVEDPCAIGLRAKNLVQLPWRSCRPPSMETGANDHGPRPPGYD
jgi:hypothetical protein